ncbi:hypothetical protein [Psychrobacillus sp. FJAT-51614]
MRELHDNRFGNQNDHDQPLASKYIELELYIEKKGAYKTSSGDKKNN